jgi:hypothetical protein
MSPIWFIFKLDSTLARVAAQPTPIGSASLLPKRYVKIGASKTLRVPPGTRCKLPFHRSEMKTSSDLILKRVYCKIMNGTRMKLRLLSAGAVLTKLLPYGSAQRFAKEEG